MSEWMQTSRGQWTLSLYVPTTGAVYIPGDDGRIMDSTVAVETEWSPALGRANFLVIESDGQFSLLSPYETRPAFYGWTVRRDKSAVQIEWWLTLAAAWLADLDPADAPDPPEFHETAHTSLDDAVAAYRVFMTQSFPQPSRFRPAWIEGVPGCAMIQLWAGTGEIDHTFEDLANLLTAMHEAEVPRNTLIYFWGWFAPFDTMYPEYWPAEDLGGEGGLRKVIETANRFGYRLMPHLNHHGFNSNAPRFSEFADAQATNAAGEPQGWREEGEPAIEYMRPCHKKWQQYHSAKLARFIEAFPVDSIFWDQYGTLIDDPECNYFTAAHRFADVVQGAIPNTVITSEILSERIYDLPLWMQWGTPWCGLPVREDIPHSDILGRLFTPLLAGTFGHQGTPAAVPVPHTWPSYYWYIQKWGRTEAVRRAHRWHKSVGAVPSVRINYREHGLDETATRILRGEAP